MSRKHFHCWVNRNRVWKNRFCDALFFTNSNNKLTMKTQMPVSKIERFSLNWLIKEIANQNKSSFFLHSMLASLSFRNGWNWCLLLFVLVCYWYMNTFRQKYPSFTRAFCVARAKREFVFHTALRPRFQLHSPYFDTAHAQTTVS